MATAVESIKMAPSFVTSAPCVLTRDRHSTVFTGSTRRLAPAGRKQDHDVRGATALLQHPQRVHVHFEHRLLLAALVGILLAHAHDGAQRLDIEASALGLG